MGTQRSLSLYLVCAALVLHVSIHVTRFPMSLAWGQLVRIRWLASRLWELGTFSIGRPRAVSGYLAGTGFPCLPCVACMCAVFVVRRLVASRAGRRPSCPRAGKREGTHSGGR